MVWATDTLAELAAAGPSDAYGWEPPEALAQLAASELICIPLVYAYVGYEVSWRSAPRYRPDGPPGSILGGVGAAVLSGTADRVGAARLAAWLGSPAVQLELVRASGGQPATRSAWTAPGGDPLFAAVLPTLQASLLRPRDPWWPAFQNDAGDLLARATSRATRAAAAGGRAGSPVPRPPRGTVMKITAVNCHVLLDPGYDVEATSSNQDTIVVEIETDEGVVGIGETDLNAWVARACIEAPGTHTMDRGLKTMLIGRDPTDPAALWDELYVGTAMTGRRGALVHALGAIDMALWDIAGKAAGVPTWRLLGEQRPESRLVPYASLLPNAGSDWEEFADALGGQAIEASKRGFRAAKLELLTRGPYRHTGLSVPDEKLVDVIAAVRRATGPEFSIMVDVGYGWDDWRDALAVVETWAEHDVFFIETPLWSDDLEGYAELSRHSPVPVAAGEWLATRFEFRAYTDRGALHVLQPDVGRVGGLTEARRVAAARRRARSARGAAWLEDGDHRGGHGAPGGGHAAAAVLRIRAARRGRVEASPGVGPRRAQARSRRHATAPRATRARDRARPGRAGRVLERRHADASVIGSAQSIAWIMPVVHRSPSLR